MFIGGSDHHAQALAPWMRGCWSRETAPFALLDAMLALDSDRNWLRQALPPVAQRLRDAVESFVGEPAQAAAYAAEVGTWETPRRRPARYPAGPWTR